MRLTLKLNCTIIDFMWWFFEILESGRKTCTQFETIPNTRGPNHRKDELAKLRLDGNRNWRNAKKKLHLFYPSFDRRTGTRPPDMRGQDYRANKTSKSARWKKRRRKCNQYLENMTDTTHEMQDSLVTKLF